MRRAGERLRRSRVVAGLAAALALSLLATPLWAQIAPTITTQPADASRSVGDSITLRVTASGSLPRRYQWQFKDADLTGANNATLVRANLTLADAGVYRVKVSNDVDTATSNPATLDVDPTFTRVSNTLVG